jgi:hypothetical protein
MKPDGDFLLQGDGKGRRDVTPYLRIGMIERQRAKEDGQAALSIADSADPVDNILNETVQCVLRRNGTERMHPRIADRYRRVGRSGEDLEGQIVGFRARICPRLREGPPNQSDCCEDPQE